MYDLPRDYLSYSAYYLWKSSRKGYRRRYYLNEAPFRTIETAFGNKIGEKVEDNKHGEDPVLSQIINYPIKEHKIEVTYEGLNLLGYLDQYDPETFSLMEMKTGHLNPQGKPPWSKLKVSRHEQLVFYSVLIELSEGQVNDEAILQWIETEFKVETREVMGYTVRGMTRELVLTGNIETYHRTIEQWERDLMKKEIIKVAKEIHDDYKQWRKENPLGTHEGQGEGITQEKPTT